MKLLIVTGIAYSNWRACAESTDWGVPIASDDVQLQLTNALGDKATPASAKKLKDWIASIESNPIVVFLADVQSHLETLLANPDVKVVNFYNGPETMVAHFLSVQPQDIKQCLKLSDTWQEMLKHAYDVYRSNKENCLLIDAADFASHTARAEEMLHGFCGAKAQLKPLQIAPSSDTLLSAKLVLQDQDDLFDFYDEIRSDAPTLGAFAVSGVNQSDEVAELALGALVQNRNQRQKLVEVQQNNTALTERKNLLESELDVLASSVESLNATKSSLESELQGLKAQLAALEDDKKANEQSLAQLAEQLKTAEASEKQKSEQFTQQINSLQGQLSSAQTTLQEKQSAFESQHKQLTEQISNLDNQLQSSRGEISKLAEQHQATIKQLDSVNQDSELQLVQIAQLQEELESTFAQLQEQKQLVEQHSAQSGKLSADKQELQAQIDVQAKQVSELQQSMEAERLSHEEQVKALQQTIGKLNQSVDQLQAKLVEAKQTSENAAKQELRKHDEQEASLRSELELQLLQIAQLQEELETVHQQLAESQQATAKNTELDSERVAALEVDNELASLQICQLQEELEFYYLKLIEKEESNMVSRPITDKPIYKAFDKCTASGAELVSGYSTDGYQDIQLNLHDVTLVDGRAFDVLPCKLISVEGRVGVEFRPVDGGLELHWLDEFSDEYGCYLTYLPNPPESKLDKQLRIDERLIATDRLAILSIASQISDALQSDNLVVSKAMEEGELRDWRLSALELKQQIAALPVWLSFDNLYLLENMQSDGYEHLWLKFDNLLFNEQFYPHFEVKFAATNMPGVSLFTRHLTMELRELGNGNGPLQAWPPATKDDYGCKFLATVDLESEDIFIQASDKVSQRDKQLIRHLLKNLDNFINHLESQGVALSRAANDWLDVAAVLKRVGDFEKAESGVSQGQNQQALEVESTDVTSLFTFEEHVDLGGYQHIVFEYPLTEDAVLKIKVRADEISGEGDSANLALELRTGDEQVPFSQSRYFAEDDYGPRVRLALTEVDELIFDEAMERSHRDLIAQFIEALPNLLELVEGLDEHNRTVWSDWFSVNRAD